MPDRNRLVDVYDVDKYGYFVMVREFSIDKFIII